MKRILIPLGTIGSSGILATGSWLIYDKQINPILSKRYGNQWKPIQATFTTPPETNSADPYKGSSCFQRFFRGIEIKEFSADPSSTDNSTSEEFNTLFDNTASDIYGCAVGIGWGTYELVLKNDQIGFATWYDKNKNNQYQQKTLILNKEDEGNWKVKLGVWTTYATDTQLATNDFTKSNQIKRNTNNRPWIWLFMMNQTTSKNSENIQEWDNVFNTETTKKAIYDINANKWKSNTSATSRKGQIPKFDKVEDLTNFCKTQGAMRKEKETEDDKVKKLNLYCLAPQSSNK